MVDSKFYEEWMRKARGDMRSAQILKDHDGDNEAVAFHCQQAIEKALKAYLLKNTAELKTGHSLVYLCKEAVMVDNRFRTLLKDCAFVNQYYIETRYPGEYPFEVADDEVQECFHIAGIILELVGTDVDKE